MSDDELWDEIMDHYDSPYHQGTFNSATHQAKKANKSCGDSVHLQLRLDHGYIMEAWFDGDGCCMSQGAASMLCRTIEGKKPSDLPTAQEWLERFKGVVTPKKRQCVLLSYEALAQLIAEIS